MQKIFLMIVGSCLCLGLLLFFPDKALADGTETLGPPANLTVATGTGIVAAGTGVVTETVAQPAAISLEVPASATIKQTLLYWEGQMATDVVGDNTILINGTEITGNLIGGPTFFFSGAYSSAFRADITSLNLVNPGSNLVTVAGLTFSKVANGAGILVIYDDGTAPAEIGLRDGLDLAYINFPGDRKNTVKQTFTFASSPMTRTADIVIFASSVEGSVSGGIDRPDSIEITIDNQVQVFKNPLNSNDGEEWDTVELPVVIPPGASSLAMQLFSRNDDDPANTTNPKPASMAWIGAGFAIVPPTATITIEKATNGEDADLPTGPEIVVGDPVTWTYAVTNTGEVTLNNVTVTDNQGIIVNCPLTMLTPSQSMTCIATGIATVGQYANIGSVTGTPETGGPPVTDSDPSHYIGLELAAVGDKVFRDENNNGIQDVGEVGVDGIIVELYDSNNNLITTTTTTNGGMYLFDRLRPGDYSVKFINSTGSGVCTTPNAGNNDDIDSDGIPVANDARGPACQTESFPLAPGQTDRSRDLGLFYPAVGINLEKATNGEDADLPTGPQIQVGDPVTWTYEVTNIGNVTLISVTVTDDQDIFVDCPQTTLIPSESMICTATGTAIEGQYANMGTVVGTPVDGSGDVSDTDPSHYFGYLLASVGNFVFGDIDPNGATPGEIAAGNGIQDGDSREQGIDGIIVKLFNSNDELISTTVTTNGGQYLFEGLVPGEYCLVFVNPTGNDGIWTFPNQGSDDEIDSDAEFTFTDPDGEALKTPCFTLTSGQTDLSWDAGLTGLSGTASSAAGNRVWIDANRNGLQDAGEVGFAGATVRIYTEDGQPVAETQTNDEGIYNFDGLNPGRYYIEFVPPTDYLLTAQKVGTDDEIDSDIDPTTGQTIVFTLEPFETNLRFDLGIFPDGTTSLPPTEEPLQFSIYLPFISE